MTATAGRVEVARVADQHLPALTAFFRQVWDPGATVDSVRASRALAAVQNPVSPGEPPPTWLVLQDGRAIAHVTTIPITLWLDQQERGAYWIKGLWVLPEIQRSSAGFLVLRAAVSALDGCLSLVHEPAAIRLFQALGFLDLGALPNHLRILRPTSVLEKLDLDRLGLDGLPRSLRAAVRLARLGRAVTGPVVNAGMHAWAAAGSMTAAWGRPSIEVVAACDRDAVDRLWHEVRQGVGAGPARGGAQLAQRYGRGDEYCFVHVRTGARLSGLGVVKRPRAEGDARLRGVRIATLSDLLYSPGEPQAGLAVLRGAERAAAALGADAVLCSASPAPLRPLLLRRAWLPLPANLRVLCRFAGAPPPARLAEWWVTRGDSDADGVF